MNRLYALLFCVIPWTASAQVGGTSTFDFLRLSPSARITALGGSLMSVQDDDIAAAVQNPGLLNSAMHQSLSFQHNFHFAGVYNGNASYAHALGTGDITLHGGVQFMQYGKFDRADEFGNRHGEFSANEFALTVGAAKQFAPRLSAGVNLRLVNSNLESYHALALLADIGGAYVDPGKKFTAALAIRNVGAQLSTYDGVREDAPLDIQLGISKRLQHLPFRLTIIAHHLHDWNLEFDGPLSEEETNLIGDAEVTDSRFDRQVDNFFRHFIFGGEFLLGKNDNVQIRLGYNHQLRREMSLAALRSFAGFSLGFGLKIKQFRFDYGFAVHHVAGSTKHIGISTNLSRFGKEDGILD
jgi:hypothetical protein